jgi:hypothetical protein
VARTRPRRHSRAHKASSSQPRTQGLVAEAERNWRGRLVDPVLGRAAVEGRPAAGATKGGGQHRHRAEGTPAWKSRGGEGMTRRRKIIDSGG